jgi:hypothetical protein
MRQSRSRSNDAFFLATSSPIFEKSSSIQDCRRRSSVEVHIVNPVQLSEENMRCNLLHSMTVSLIAAASFLSLPAMRGFGDVINLGTAVTSNWTVTWGGAANAPAFEFTPSGFDPGDPVSLTGICITSDGDSPASQFNGFWYADADFQLPSNASSVSLVFSTLRADDRVVLELNGNILGDYFLNGLYANPPLTGLGVMSLTSGDDAPYTFTGISSGTITSGFILGGENDLRMIVNNTGQAVLTAPTVSGGPTHAELTALVSYSVPEPGALALSCIGSIALLRRRPCKS